ncbi:MAG: squalene--hopene cyclase [Pirellulaceae bacterium]|nr:MAG: squalene--hopene cyclase [Pirellulaceae bacterium]
MGEFASFKKQWCAPLLAGPLLAALCSMMVAAADLSLETVTPPPANVPDEPMAGGFSLERAVAFLDQAALDWTKSRQCFTCHTNYLYLIARPMYDSSALAHQQVRQALETLVEKRWIERGPRWDAEVVMSAAVLAINDRLTTGRLHPTTRKALDRMWQVQRPDGGVNWLKCDWPPMESDDDFGVTVMLLAALAAPDNYCHTPEAQAGLAKIRGYLERHPPPTLHHRAMLLWADSFSRDLLPPDRRQAIIDELFATQHPDGGWNLATLGDWKRADGTPQDLSAPDGYGTGFAVFVLRQAGVPANDARIAAALRWLTNNQRASGRWFTRSLHKDSKHFITHAGTAFAVMALQACQTEPSP